MITDLRYLLAVTIVAVIPRACFPQAQGNIWYFGINAGLDFNSSPVSVLGDGATEGGSACGDITTEGTASISDSLGNINLYSDGKTVWNRNHGVMPNGHGLLGGLSSTHACLIVPQPTSNSIYYIFTLDDFCNNFQNGLRYSIVNLCSDGGNGDVVMETKNTLLLDTASEKMALVQHSNGVDYWLVVQKYFSNAFYCFPITATGIGSPMISYCGTVHEPLPGIDEYVSAIGQIKASPLGNRLAIAAGNGAGLLEVFQFDNEAGSVTLLYSLSSALPQSSGYGGVSFSKNGNLLYTTFLNLYQFNLSAGDEASVKQSITQLSPSGGLINYHGLQLGPDGKVYVARGSNTLSVIRKPNLVGSASDYQHDIINLGSGLCEYSFPTFLDSYEYQSSGFCIHSNSLAEATITQPTLFLYPNPAHQSVRVEVQSSTFNVQSLSVTDMLGEAVLNLEPQTLNFELNIAGLANGVYTVAVQDQNGQLLRQRLVVQH